MKTTRNTICRELMAPVLCAAMLGLAGSAAATAQDMHTAQPGEIQVNEDGDALDVTVDDEGNIIERHECSSTVTGEAYEILDAMMRAGQFRAEVGDRYSFQIPVTVHLVRRSNGVTGMTQANIDAMFVTLNTRYQGTGMQFFQNGATRNIDNDNMYLNTDTQGEINAICNTDLIPDTLNLYLTNNLRTDDGPDPDNLPDSLCGMGSFTSTSGFQAVIIDFACATNASTVAHEIGHFFNLFHTHETAHGSECPDGSNCSNNGDDVCDTPADPDLTNLVTPDCAYFGTAMRCGQLFNPDPTNVMSYSQKSCRTYFSPGQIARLNNTLFNQRGNLLGWQLGIIWVDFYDDSGSGTFYDPYNNLQQAVNAVASGGIVIFKPSVNLSPITINKPLTLDTFRGASVTIGGF